MWTSLCNFLYNKLFHTRKIGFQHSRSDSSENIYGKRMKLVDRFWNTNAAVNQSTASLSMQKENIEISDDEEECCIIAEIPRRKKPWSFTKPEKKDEPSPSHVDQISNDSNSSRSCTSPLQISFRKSSLDNITDDKDVKFLGSTPSSDEATKTLAKKFFTSQRICRNQGKVAKARLSYKQQLRKRMNFLQESYRLTEKFQYMQLLQSQTNLNLLSVKSPLKMIKWSSPVIEVIDLTDDKVGTDTNEITALATVSKSEDQDVQIVKEVSGVRSFQDLLKLRPSNTDVTVNELLSIHSKDSSDITDLNKSEASISLEDNCRSQKTELLEEKLRNFFLSTTSLQEVQNVNAEYSLPELSLEQKKQIKNALTPHPSDEVLSQGFGLQITRRDMRTLFGLNWLNDQIINFYCSLIVARSETNKNLPKVFAFNTFFYTNLVTSGYTRVRRWTKQVNIFSYDLILVPIHLGMHWCMAIIDFRNKSIRYYDSIGSPNDSCLESLLLYLKAEKLDKTNNIMLTDDWEKTNVDDIPQQMNGADCGVFSCMFAEYLARDCSITFTQDDMPYFRKKMVIEILDKKLLT